MTIIASTTKTKVTISPEVRKEIIRRKSNERARKRYQERKAALDIIRAQRKIQKAAEKELALKKHKELAAKFKLDQKELRRKNKEKQQSNSYIELALKSQINKNKFVSLHNKSLNITWRNNKQITADIKGTYKSIPFLVEYDGAYWHSKRQEIDTEKTEILLNNGYIVIRVRESPLEPLSIIHKNLLQIIYTGKTDHKTCDFSIVIEQIIKKLEQ